MKKYILIGILVITVALALSAFTLFSGNRSTGSQVGQTQGSAILDKGDKDFTSSIAVTGFQTPPMSSYVQSRSERGFQTPPMSNYVQSRSERGFQTPPMSNYAQSSAVSGAQTPHYYEYGPASAASSAGRSGSYLVVVSQFHDR